MVQKRIIKAVSFALTIWYLLCVVGFDVHTCNHSGKSFVSSLVSGVACEDFHHECGHDTCPACQGHGVSGKSCCTDDIMVLSLTGGDREENEGHHHHHDCACSCGHCPVLADLASEAGLYGSVQVDVALPDFYGGHFLKDNILSVFSVWRI